MRSCAGPNAATRAGRIRDASVALPVLVALAGIVRAAPPSGTPEKLVPRRCPSEMALVESTCVDRWEASIVEVRPGGVEIAWSPYHSPHGHEIRAVSKPGVVPQGYISMAEAKRACEGAGKRLCKPYEWKAACKGPSSTLYPYGDVHVPGACVDANRTAPLPKLHPGKDMFENKSMIDPQLNMMANTVARTGEAPACTNSGGAFDMVGNLHEWTDDGTLHGGFYLDVTKLHEGCDYVTTAHAPIYYDYSTGFRCCADPTFGPEQTKTAKKGKKIAKR